MKKFIGVVLGLVLVSLTSCVIAPPVEHSTTEPETTETNQVWIVQQSLLTSNLDYNEWRLQYPSGNETDGMLSCNLSSYSADKYLRLTDSGMNFILDAEDKGKSTNGSSVRVELTRDETYSVDGNTDFSFYETITAQNESDLDNLEFTICQVMRNYSYEDIENRKLSVHPILMIRWLGKNCYTTRCDVSKGKLSSNVGNRIVADVKFYTDGAGNKVKDTEHYTLIDNAKASEEFKLEYKIDNRKLDIYINDGESKTDGCYYPEEQDLSGGLISKFGIYYQCYDEPDPETLTKDGIVDIIPGVVTETIKYVNFTTSSKFGIDF